MEAPQGEPEDPRLAEDVTQSDGHNLTDQLGTHSRDWHHDPSQSPEQIQDQSPSGQDTESWKQQQQQQHQQQRWRVSLQPDFQDSNLSPALPLLPANTRVDNTFAECSLFQPSDNDFSPLRPNPDTSVASESFQRLPGDDDSLSQHPLLQESVLSEGERMSCGSLSQHSLSPAEDKSREEQPSGEEDVGGSRVRTSSSPEEPPDKAAGEDQASALRKEPPAEQDDVDRTSSSQTSVKLVASSSKAPDSFRALQPDEQPDGHVHADQSGTARPESLNVSVGPRSSRPDDSSELLRRELQSESQRSGQRKSPSPPTQPAEGARGLEPGGGGGPTSEPASPAVRGGHREADLWSSASQAGVEGSYVDFLPQSQSTPGVSAAPLPASGTKGPAGRLSTIHSDQSDQSGTGPAPLPAHVPSGPDQQEEDGASSQVQSLPTVSFKQKVDAWRANQGSASVSLFDTLALQGFSGVSPKQRAFDAVSDTLNEILSQKLNSLKPSPAAEHDAPVWRGEAVGSAPEEGEDVERGEEVKEEEVEEERFGSAPGPSASTHHGSQSRMDPDQQGEAPADPQGDAHQQQSDPWARPSAPLTLDQFSDVSPDPDSTLSFSQGSRAKLDTSAGASSAPSLDVDNYAPYWTSAASTPPPRPRPRDVNIEERIPLYLHNLGIDQSPATILNPFAPRGPIREPEFSPTDLLTIKGSVGTSTRSSQPSEGGTPQKGDFSRSSILSVESSLSIPVSLDSLGASAQLGPSSQQDEDSYPSTVQTVLRQQRPGSLASSQNTIPPGDAFDSDLDESSSLVGSQSQTETVVPSAAAAAPPHTLSAEDILLSLRKKTSRLLDFSDVSSGPGWARSSSDSMLASERLIPPPLSQSARRAEPEGCSAAAADTPAPPPTVVQTPPTMEEEEEKELPVPPDAPTHGHAPSPPPHEDGDTPAAAMSDAGSESSLALRVAKLLQGESSGVAGTSSTAELEGSRAREWLRLKMSGQQCEPLELDREDRMRIEEIKRELLLLHPITDSTDTESSAASTAGGLTRPAAVTAADHRGQQSLSLGPSHPGLQFPAAPGPVVEAVEGVSPPRTGPQAITSITIATRRRTPSPSPGPPLSPVPEPLHLSQLSGETSLGLDLNLMNRPAAAAAAAAAAAGQSSSRVQLGDAAPPAVQVSDPPPPEVTRSPRPESPPTPAHVSYARLTLSPKAVVGHSLPPAGQPRLLSSDEGLGLSSPPEWSDHREPIRERAQQPPSSSSAAALFHPTSDLREGRGSSPSTAFRPPTVATTSPRDETTARLRNSESPVPVLLPYKPHGSEELFYVPQTGSGLQSDTTLESSHTDSDDAVAPPFSTNVLGRGDPTLDRGVSIRHTEGIYSKRLRTTGHQGVQFTAAGRSSQMELGRGQRSSSPGSVGTAPPPRRHQDPERDGGGPLDQLWLKFCSQWRQEESRLSAERDASLLERLERLSRLIGRGDEQRREGGGQDASAGRPAGRPPASGQDWTRPLPPQEAAPPAGGAPADSASAASGSVSSVDTTRLARVFGAERVRRLRTSASIHKLHRTILEQKEGKNKEAAADSFSQSEASDQVAADSASSTSTFTVLSHRRTPAARKPVGLVSRGVQAGGLQLDWSSRTGRHTRDQGLGHAPSPSCSSSAASERGGGGGGGRSPARTSQRRRRIFPKSVSWFVSAEELRSEARKENRPAGGTTGGRSSAWFQPYGSAAPWREPLRQRQVPEDRSSSNSSRRHYHRPGDKTTPPAGAPVSLQEALRRNRPEFIHQSRQRVERLALRSEDRRLQELYREVHEVYSMEPPRRPAGTVLLRRAVPRTEMIQRSKQIYESLPEVQRRRADQRRKAEYELYRLNARLYNKKITSRVVNRRTAWN